ncbi:sugar porter family MFS transporter [Aureobasidium pullulans]|uniref:Sugar porter family MFS transporter n=1 Tax=Aureobasidium pullulans TaxID=5580 RepID=A0A4S9EAN9_AURPU|nr:sugar porter family MFS transporter [Aureobasidium pullulans]
MEKEFELSHLEDSRSHAAPSIMKDAVGDAVEAEGSMGFLQAVRLYPMAIFWSVGMSTAVIMEGYAVMLLSSFYALPQFNRKYGQQQPDGTFVVPASWKSGLSNGALCGEILGLFLTGIFQDRYGYRKTICAALLMVTGFIFILFFANGVEMLLVGEILCGIPWGAFQTITTAYASEICPVALRAYLTTYVNLCWVIGQLVVSGVLKGVLDRQDQWAYRIPFAVQWIWPIPLLVICILAPESPWWYVRHGQLDRAKKSLERLMSQSNDMADHTVAMMQHTDQLEKEASSGTSYLECFRPSNIRRTEIVCFVWLIQIICGSQLMGYSTVFYVAAGLNERNSFTMSLIQYSIGAIGTILSWFLMSRVGRRTIYLYGLAILFALLMVIGFVSLAPRSDNVNWTIAAMLSVFTFIYDLTVGPVCYSLVAELSSTRLRAKSVVLARNLYNIGGIVVNVLINYQLTSTAWDWGARSAFFWGGSCLCCAIWTFFRLPEPSGRTYAELDILFANNVPARKFATTQVDVVRGTIVAEHEEF